MKITNSAHRLRELLSLTGDTQNDMARKTKIPKSSISHYINGEREPRQDKLSQISEAYNVNPAWLMGLDVPKESIETLQGKMTKARLDFLMLDENDTEHILENKEEFENAKALYEKLQSSNEFLKLFENATPEAQKIVESFLKSQQQQP